MVKARQEKLFEIRTRARSKRLSETRTKEEEERRMGAQQHQMQLINDKSKYLTTDTTQLYKPRFASTSHRLKNWLLALLGLILGAFLLWQAKDLFYNAINSKQQNYLTRVDSPSELGRARSYSVSTDAHYCAPIGSAVLAKGGSAIDAAISTLLCMGVVLPNSLGLGGGCLINYYDRKTRKAYIIDGRETAPHYAHENMYIKDPWYAFRGPLSVGVPGELAAYWTAHQMFGKLNWSQLFDDAIVMAENGLPLVEHVAHALKVNTTYLSPHLATLFTHNQTGKLLGEGDLLVQKQLANTMRKIRDNGIGEFYGGSVGQQLINDLRQQGGNMTLDDLVSYKAIVREPLVVQLDEDLVLHTVPPPGSGVILSVILRIMKRLGYYKNKAPLESQEQAQLYYHRLVEAFKFAYAQRASLEDKPDDPMRMQNLMKKLNSEEFIKLATNRIDGVAHEIDYYGDLEIFKEDHGTAHVSVIDSEGNAAAVTSSINLYFGSGLLSPSTGIVYNDIMDDFASPNLTNKFDLPATKYNRIRPGKRPVSSMAPSIFTDGKGDARLIIGGSGGSKITSAIASVSLRNCFLGDDVKVAIDAPRLHHQFLPNAVIYEKNFPRDHLEALVERGHQVKEVVGRSSVIMAIARDASTGEITANSDYRKGGSVDGL